MTSPTVLFCGGEADGEFRGLLDQACRDAGVGWCDWPSGEGAGPSRPGSAAAMVGVLPTGKRRVPDELVAVVTEEFPGLPLVLLCREPLVREVVVLDAGRVTLLSHPVTPDRLGARLKILAKSVTGATALDDRPVVLQGPHWWAAAIARPPVTGQGTPAGEPSIVSRRGPGSVPGATVASAGAAAESEWELPAPLLAADPDGVGLTAALVAGPPVRLAPEAWKRWGAALGRVLPPEGMAPPAPAGIAVVRLTGGHRARWGLGGVAGVGGWLLNQQRLPRVFDASGPVERRPAAVAGDVLVMDSRPVDEGSPPPRPDDELCRAAARGGPAVTEVLTDRIRRSATPWSAVVVEVR